MTLIDFINKFNGVGDVGNTPENKGECVGLVMVWLKDQGLPHIWGHAKDLLVNAGDSYEVIENTPDAIPEPGDVIVWRQGFNGTFGHTAIVVKGNVKTFEVFEQNNPLGSPCRLHTYPDYSYVDGWLRNREIITQPIANIPSAWVMDDQTIIDLGQYGKMEVQAIRGKMGDLERAKNQIISLEFEIEVLDEKIKDLQDALEIHKSRIRAITEELKECQSKPPQAPKNVSYSWAGLIDYFSKLLITG